MVVNKANRSAQPAIYKKADSRNTLILLSKSHVAQTLTTPQWKQNLHGVLKTWGCPCWKACPVSYIDIYPNKLYCEGGSIIVTWELLHKSPALIAKWHSYGSFSRRCLSTRQVIKIKWTKPRHLRHAHRSLVISGAMHFASHQKAIHTLKDIHVEKASRFSCRSNKRIRKWSPPWGLCAHGMH